VSGKPINLNKARKAKARAEKSARGTENAAKFGRTKAQKAADEATVTRLNAHLDRHKTENN